MKTKTRNIIIIIGAVLLIFLGLFGYGVWKIYSDFRQIRTNLDKEIPAELKEAKVFKGEGFLQKREFFKLQKLSYTELIGKSSQVKDEKEKQKLISSETAKEIFGFDDLKTCGAEIVAAGKFGGYVFDESGNLKREIYFEPKVQKIKVFGFESESFRKTVDELRIVDFENDGNCEFISESSVDGVVVFDSQGQAAWRYGDRSDEVLKQKTNEDEDNEVYVTNVTVADLTDDGVLEYILSVKNDGVHALDLNKNEIWFQPDEFPTADFRVVDIDGDGKTELLELQGMSSTIRDKKTGGVIRKLEIDGWRKDFLIYEDATKKKSVRFFHIDENKFIFSDANNKILMEMEAPLSEIKIKQDKPDALPPTPYTTGDGKRAEPAETYSTSDSEEVYKPKAVQVNLQKDKPKYLAVIGTFGSFQRTNFYIYDEKGTLVYHELLPEDARTIAVISAPNAVEEILIGGKDTIWKFSAK